MKTQDLHYVSMLKHMNERKLEGLKAVLPHSLSNQDANSEHILFAEDEEEKSAIIAQKFPEANEDSEDIESGSDSDNEVAPQTSKRSAALHEYEIRKQRIETLTLAERKLQAQKHIMQPGRRRVVGHDEYEQPIFKWKAQRKK